MPDMFALGTIRGWEWQGMHARYISTTTPLEQRVSCLLADGRFRWEIAGGKPDEQRRRVAGVI
jgi:hypothetical protein